MPIVTATPPAAAPLAAPLWPASLVEPLGAVRHALARAAACGNFAAPALTAAAAHLGSVACRAGLPLDALLAAVNDVVQLADGPYSPEEDAVLLYLWRLAGRAYQSTAPVAPRPPHDGPIPPSV